MDEFFFFFETLRKLHKDYQRTTKKMFGHSDNLNYV